MGRVTVDGPMSHFITDGFENEIEVCVAIDYAALGGEEVVVNYYKDYPKETIGIIREHARKRNIKVYFRRDDIETDIELM